MQQFEVPVARIELAYDLYHRYGRPLYAQEFELEVSRQLLRVIATGKKRQLTLSEAALEGMNKLLSEGVV
ncbi:hypothetical protein [Neptuniibacter sp. QD37_11]|uniref:hypothetical protein n=1 Tax=Neptuniibacter sp. QD37_11 TaxID=3398209 RepID=UPI0039F47B0F